MEFNSHFRTITFYILSHLADRDVRLSTYFHNLSIRHLTPAYMICHKREAVVKRNDILKPFHTHVYYIVEGEILRNTQ